MSTYMERVTIVRSQIDRLDTLCAGIVTRDGEEDACCKPATSIVYDAEGADVWPACTWHAHRYGGALTLEQIREALATGATHFGARGDLMNEEHECCRLCAMPNCRRLFCSDWSGWQDDAGLWFCDDHLEPVEPPC